MVDSVVGESDAGASQKRMTFSTRMSSWFPFIAGTSPRSAQATLPDGEATSPTGILKSLSQRFSFKRRKSAMDNRRSVDTRKSVEKTSVRSGDDISTTSNNNNRSDDILVPLTVVTYKGDETDQMARASGSNRTSIKKRASSRRFKGMSRGKSQKFEITEDMMNLQRIICDAGYRQKLIEMLIPLDGDSSVKVRFCCAVEEYQREKDKALKKKKGAQIVKMFARKGSMFRLKNLSKEHEKSLRAKKYDTLETVKNITLDELVVNQVVAKTMKDILAAETELSVKDTESRRMSQEPNDQIA